jgi:hypothetical protein
MTLPKSVGQIQFYFFLDMPTNTNREHEFDSDEIKMYLELLPFDCIYSFGSYATEMLPGWKITKIEALIWIYVTLDKRIRSLISVENDLLKALKRAGFKARIPG